MANLNTNGTFRPTIVQEAQYDHTNCIYHHISCMPEYKNYSPEELRLLDYTTNDTLRNLHSGLLPARYQGFTLFPPPPVTIAQIYTHYGGDVVTFEVGKHEPQSFAIHEPLVTHRSEFVRLAIQNQWREAKERHISMPDDEPDIFEIYQVFLYDRNIYRIDGLEQFRKLVKAYILGEKLVDIGFKNAVIDAIIIRLRTTSYFDPRLTNLVYDNTPDTSPLRRLIRDIYVWTGNARWFNERELDEPINGDFMRDANESQFHARQGTGPAIPHFLDDCNGWDVYHEEAVLPDEVRRKCITPATWRIQPW